MKILEFQYSDKATNWQINPIKFNQLTLLVGASGVGKTRILQAIDVIKNIALGGSISGVFWKISFSIGSDIYVWEGEFELVEERQMVGFFIGAKGMQSEDKKPSILFEKMTLNGEIIVDREGTSIVYKGEKSPIPIKGEQSVIALIPDPIIQKIEHGFKKISYSDYTGSVEGYSRTKMVDNGVISKYNTVNELREAEDSLFSKLYWVSKKDQALFEDIKEDFITVFPQVVDIIFRPLDFSENSDVPLYLKAAPFIQFKEEESVEWIPVMSMSAGMYRTLVHIVELYLSADGTVILIDEFENSLGVNCIDELTTEIKGAINRIQFIITSHHPYIINNIHYNNWKVVTRNNNTVYTQDAKEFNLDKSKHEAFIQLLNLPSYKTGKHQ